MNDNGFKRNFSTSKIKVTAITTGRNPKEGKETTEKNDKSNEFPSKFLKWFGGAIVALITVIGGLWAAYEFGYSDGEKDAIVAYPAEYATIEVALNSSNANNIELQSENKVLTNELEMVRTSLEEALQTPLVDEKNSTLTEQQSNPVVKPVKSHILKDDSFLFFDVLNVSLVNISKDENGVKNTTLTVSALNSEAESFSDLRVGDKRTYTTNDSIYEVLISANSGYSVDVTVGKY